MRRPAPWIRQLAPVRRSPAPMPSAARAACRTNRAAAILPGHLPGDELTRSPYADRQARAGAVCRADDGRPGAARADAPDASIGLRRRREINESFGDGHDGVGADRAPLEALISRRRLTAPLPIMRARPPRGFSAGGEFGGATAAAGRARPDPARLLRQPAMVGPRLGRVPGRHLGLRHRHQADGGSRRRPGLAAALPVRPADRSRGPLDPPPRRADGDVPRHRDGCAPGWLRPRWPRSLRRTVSRRNG